MIRAPNLEYRKLGPEDAASVWLSCAHREPRPTLDECGSIVSDQLVIDEAVSGDYGAWSAGAVRRLLALSRYGAAGLVTVRFGATAEGWTELHIDPFDERYAADMLSDALQWAARGGAVAIEPKVYGVSVGPSPDRPLVVG